MRKQTDRQYALALLKKHNIDYKVKNGGSHLVVKGNGKVIDFWPTTQRFVIRGQEEHYHGVALLIKLIKSQTTNGLCPKM